MQSLSMIRLTIAVGCLFVLQMLASQTLPQGGPENEELDSLYIEHIENRPGKLKLLHAEPLYIDLIRDLGARKGEKEWNVGIGLTDNQDFDSYLSLVEYEWAPIDRLGLEIELPFTFYYTPNERVKAPGSRLNSLKLAGQYTFLVDEKSRTSMAIGYIHEFELNSFNQYKIGPIYKGNRFNPFLVLAKRWGTLYHSLIYAGPAIDQHFNTPKWHTTWQVNSNFHYMVSGTRNFIGIELNKEWTGADFSMIVRPQMRIEITEKLMVGIVTGIPVSRRNERFSSFLRLIYEPGH
jgi:hypothetical protein